MSVIGFVFKGAKGNRKSYLWACLCLFVIGFYDAFRPFLTKEILDSALARDGSKLAWLGGYYIVMQFVLIAVWGIAEWCLLRFQARLRVNVLEGQLQKLYTNSYQFFQENTSGQLTAKLGDILQSVTQITSIALYQFLYFTLLVTLGISTLSFVFPLGALCMLLWLGLFTGVFVISLRNVGAAAAKKARTRANLLAYAADFFANALSIKFFAQNRRETALRQQLSSQHVEASDGFCKSSVGFGLLQDCIVATYAIVYFSLALTRLYSGELTPGSFAMSMMLHGFVVSQAYVVSQNVREFVNAWGSIKQALKVLNEPPTVLDQPSAPELQLADSSIRFEKVSFAYEEGRQLFCNLSISIPARQKVGLVGYSGGGKSSFVGLILRLFDVQAGRVLVGGADIKTITQDSLRKQIAVIPQDPSLFARTLYENIAYAKEGATEAEVYEAAKKAHAADFIDILPQKYQSLVGERGIKLSGGQRQRIAIARAILKDAPIWVLDEATSQLDSVTEQTIQESLQGAMATKTALVIAHRLSTLLHMDRILVFDKGQIVQDGTHAELLAQDGLYKTLWKAQVGGFLPS